MLISYLKTGFRNLLKNKTNGFLNIIGLSVGMACAGLIFLWIEDEITFDDIQLKRDRLYELKINWNYAGTIYTIESSPRPMGAAIKREIPGIEDFARLSYDEIKSLFSIGDRALYIPGRYADASVFNLLTLPFVAGSPKTAFSSPYCVVITEKAAAKLFLPGEQVMGRMIRMDNKQDFLITGIIKDLPANSSFRFEWLAPFENDLQKNQGWENNWGQYSPVTLVELQHGANLTVINRQLEHFISRKSIDRTTTSFLFPLKDLRLYNSFANGKPTGEGRITNVRTMSNITWIILLIACINFMNLATARGERRMKEVGVRKVVGAGKTRLIRQFIGESFFLSMMSGCIALLIIWLTLPAFNKLMEKELALQILKPVHFLSLMIVILLTGLVAGSYPAFYLSSYKPILVLKGLGSNSASGAVVRKWLVVLQFSVSIFFIISTIVIYQQIQFAKGRQLGFNKDQLIEIDMQHDISNHFENLKQQLLHTGVIASLARADHEVLYDGNNSSSFTWEGKPKDQELIISTRMVGTEYFETLGMKLLAGQFFYPDGIGDSASIIITSSLAKEINNGDAIGRIIQTSNYYANDKRTTFQIVGIIDDYQYGNMYSKPAPVIFFRQDHGWNRLIYLRLKKSKEVQPALAKISAVIRASEPEYPFQYRFVDDQFNELFRNETLMSSVSSILAALAIVISCLGLFGLASYTAGRRLKEIGIRKVLGASVTHLTGLLSRDFIIPVAISTLIAFPLAWWYMSNWLQHYEYRIALSWTIFFIAGTLALMVAGLTISLQTVRAAGANPAKTLRNE